MLLFFCCCCSNESYAGLDSDHEREHGVLAKWGQKFESKSHLSLFTAARHMMWSLFFFAIHCVVNVVIAPNAMIGE